MNPPRRSLAWRVRAPAVLALAAGIAGCPSEPVGVRTHLPALSPSAPGSLTPIDVRKLEGKPGLTLVTRQGDPAPAIALAVATGLGPEPTIALATLIEHRLESAGHDVRLQVDRVAFRIVWWPAEDEEVGSFISALALAYATPVGEAPELFETIAQRIEALARQPLAGAALLPIARCTGALGIVKPAAAEDQLTAARLEAWRRKALTTKRTALAVVGPAAFGAETLEALDDTEPWRVGSPPPAPPAASDAHGAYTSAAIPAGKHKLELALRISDPHRAASAVARLGTSPSPLTAKLMASLESAWRVEAMRATALPAGGCIYVVLEHDGRPLLDSATMPSSAAATAAMVRRELESELLREPDPFVVPAQITTPGDPRDAAQRAAWWSLAGPAARRTTTISTALGISSQGKAGAAVKLAEVETAYRRASAPKAVRPPTPIAERRVAIERGQGEIWALLASPCALLHEGPNETGSAALAALSAASRGANERGVSLEPWVTPHGVGLLARGAQQHAAEDPLDLARRVGRALGRAFGAGPGGREPFLVAQGHLSRTLSSGATRYLERFARAAVPDHPSWLVPLGALARQQAFDHATVVRQWRGALRQPCRLAVIANADEAQAEALASEVDRWLLPAAQGGPCAQRAEASAPASGPHRLRKLPPGAEYVLVGARLPRTEPDDLRLAEATALALDGPQGALGRALTPDRAARSWHAELLGSGRAAALVIAAEVMPGRQEQVQRRLVDLLTSVSKSGLDQSDARRAVEQLDRQRLRLRADPRWRVAQLWQGLSPSRQPPLDGVRWNAWLRSAFTPAQLVVVTAPLAATP